VTCYAVKTAYRLAAPARRALRWRWWRRNESPMLNLQWCAARLRPQRTASERRPMLHAMQSRARHSGASCAAASVSS